MSAFLGIAIPLVYIVIAGIFGGIHYATATADCKDSRSVYGCSHGHDMVGGFAGLLWPAMLPAWLVGRHLTKGERVARQQIAAAKLAADLAEQQEREDRAIDRRYQQMTRTFRSGGAR